MSASATTPKSSTAQAGKYLFIGLDNESYGIAVLRVREIIRMQKITPVPQVPEFVKGVINLRGRVIPVVDLRVKFGVRAEFAERTCIVVVQVRLPSDQTVQMGLIVDRVEEVMTLTGDEIEPPPDFGMRVSTAYMFGLAKVKGRVKTLLDIDRVVSADAVEAIAKIG
jgi:purine-binding chemotaxis protein CheW